MDLIDRWAVIDVVHKSIFGFFEICDDNSEEPINEKDKLLLEVNKAICNSIKDVPSTQSDAPDINVGNMVSISAVVDMAGKSEWFESSDAYNDFVWAINALPSAQPEPLTEEEMRLLKKLRSFHSGSYAKLLDKLVASAQPEPQWISCKDRLPEVNESVLVTTEWNDISIAWRIGIDKWFIHEGNTNATTDDLAAWMPLPECYKGE